MIDTIFSVKNRTAREVPDSNIEIPLKNSKSVICSKMAHDHISKKSFSKSTIFQCPDSAKFRLGHATSTSLLIKKEGWFVHYYQQAGL